MTIIGVHANTHDSGIALLNGGEILWAASQERFDRQKMSRAAPLDALEAALTDTGIDAAEIDHLAISDDLTSASYSESFRDFDKRMLDETLAEATRYYRWKPWKVWSYWRHHRGVGADEFGRRRCSHVDAIRRRLVERGFTGCQHSYEHSLCHAIAAQMGSGFDRSLIFVMEGSSFINASSVYMGNGPRVEKLLDIPWPHSPGLFYSTLTQMLGFMPSRDEGKITGLAALGNHIAGEDFGKKMFGLHHDRDDFYIHPRLLLWWYDYRERLGGRLLPPELRRFSPEDLAAIWQHSLEDAVLGLVRRFMKLYPDVHHFAFSGGVHSNVKLNQKINELDDVKEIYVHPGMGDSGQALGAAQACWADLDESARPARHSTVYYGPAPDHNEIELLAARFQIVFEVTEDLPDAVAEMLARGKVVAICRGAMEYGPRALGNRSILCTPTDPTVNGWLNKQLNRTEFMPFAPVTLVEHTEKCYFNNDKSAYTAGFMTICYNCTDWMQQTQPAVVHKDKTARPQFISREQNPFLYNVVSRFHERTGIPSIINTSFNMHGEPIVCKAEEALRTFVTCNIDVLVLEDRLLLRENNSILREMLRATARG